MFLKTQAAAAAAAPAATRAGPVHRLGPGYYGVLSMNPRCKKRSGDKPRRIRLTKRDEHHQTGRRKLAPLRCVGQQRSTSSNRAAAAATAGLAHLAAAAAAAAAAAVKTIQSRDRVRRLSPQISEGGLPAGRWLLFNSIRSFLWPKNAHGHQRHAAAAAVTSAAYDSSSGDQQHLHRDSCEKGYFPLRLGGFHLSSPSGSAAATNSSRRVRSSTKKTSSSRSGSLSNVQLHEHQ
ncbi:hypothetical protein Emag_006565 [Eimeria magna]